MPVGFLVPVMLMASVRAFQRTNSFPRFHRHLSSSTFYSDEINDDTKARQKLLDVSLKSLNVDASELHAAVMRSLESTSGGYDGRFGTAAVKTYRSFVFPKNQIAEPLQLKASARRCAQQIDFLMKRHRSHQEEWVRHHDADSTVRQPRPLILLLDNVRSAFNVGSIFRSADASGCAQVLTTGITPHPLGSGGDKLRKSALGAEMAVPSLHFSTTKDAIAHIRQHLPNYQLVALETTERSVSYTSHPFSRSGTVLVLGNEVTGVDTEILPDMDAIVEIPMYGTKNSLNIAACAPVVLFEVIRQWNLLGEEVNPIRLNL